MLDETNFPCLKIAATIKDMRIQTNYILHMAKAVQVDLETTRLFFLIKENWQANHRYPADNEQ